MYWIPVILILPYFFLLLKIYRDLQRIKPFTFSSDPSAFVSVIVACRNEQEDLPRLLKSIEEQDYPRELFEVIIVDDDSKDKTLQKASENGGSVKVNVLHNAGKGKKQAILTGVEASKGELIITTDADCIMGKCWIRTIAAFYEKHGPDMIISPVKLADRRGFFGRFQELEFLSLQGITAGTAVSANGIMCNGANLAFTRKSYLTHLEELHPELATGDDIFFLHSLKKEGHSKILWLESNNAMVTTSPSPTLWSFFRQRKRWISKWKAYRDNYIILTGVVTVVAVILQLSSLFYAFFAKELLYLFLTVFLLKSVPDFLILQNTTGRYGRKSLMAWFIPVQALYPFYVVIVFLGALMPFQRSEY